MTEENKVPKLRFPEFTDDWEQRKLGDIFKYEQPGPYIVTNTEYDDSYTIPVLTAGQSFILGYTNEKEGIKNASPKNPVVIFDDFTTSSHYVDFPFKVKSSAMKILSLVNEKDDMYCANNVLENVHYVPGNHERHWISIFSDFDVLMPSNTEEQKKIGHFFKSLDKLITLHQRKLEKIKILKKGFLQKLFPQNGRNFPELRFPGFTGDWKQQKLGELTDFVTGKAFSSDLDDRGSYVVMDMGAVSQEGTRIETKKTNILRDPLCKGDLIMPKDDIGGGLIIGRTAYIPTDNRYLLGDHVYRLRFANENSLFVHYQINSSGLRKQIMPLVTGSAQLGLNSKNVQGVILNIPSLEEQLKIGDFFLKLDDLISLHQRKLEIYQNIKKGLLQQMFV